MTGEQEERIRKLEEASAKGPLWALFLFAVFVGTVILLPVITRGLEYKLNKMIDERLEQREQQKK